MSLLRFPLHDLHKSLGAKFGEFAGWEAPINYTSVIEEHMSVRTNVGVFDLSHMGRLVLKGVDAAKLLDKLVPRYIESKAGEMIGPTAFLNENAGIKDDVMLYNMGDSWLVIPNAVNRVKIREWLEHWASKLSLSASIEDKTFDWVLLAIQGPLAVKAMAELISDKSILELAPLRFKQSVRLDRVGATAILVSRSGWTGEDGFEIVAEVSDAEKILLTLHEKGYKLCGLGARDSLRMEMGFLLYGHEIDESINPIEARYWWVFQPGPKDVCIGCEALRNALKQGAVNRVRVGLKLSKKARIIPRQGDKVLVEDIEVGYITSGAYSPVLKRSIAQAYVKPSHALLGLKVQIEHKGKLYEAKIVEPPFISTRSSLGRPAIP